MLDLGAAEALPLTLADESRGLEGTVDPWLRSVWPMLAQRFGTPTLESDLLSVKLPGNADGVATGILQPVSLRDVSATTAEVASVSATAAADDAVASDHSPMAMMRALALQRSQSEVARRRRTASGSGEGLSIVHAATTTMPSAAFSAMAADDPRSPIVVTVAANVSPPLRVKHPAPDPADVTHLAGSTAGRGAVLTSKPPSLNEGADVGPVAQLAVSTVETDCMDNFSGRFAEPRAVAVTAGVRSLAELFPGLRYSRDGASVASAPPSTSSTAAGLAILPPGVFIPLAEVSAAAKLTPRVLPVAWDVQWHPASSAVGQVIAAPHQMHATPSFFVASDDAAVERASTDRHAVADAMNNPVVVKVPQTGASGRTPDSPLEVRVTAARYLTAGGATASRRVVHMEIDVGGTQLEGGWTPGDAIAVLAPNPEELVERLICRFGIHADARISFVPARNAVAAAALTPALHERSSPDTPVITPPVARSTATPPPTPARTDDGTASSNLLPKTMQSGNPPFVPSWLVSGSAAGQGVCIRDVLSWGVDLTSTPKKALLRLLADSASVLRERDELMFLASRDGRDAWSALIDGQRLHVLDLLALYPSANPSLVALLCALTSPQPPRYYSLACSPLVDRLHMAIAFTVVEYDVGCGVDAIGSASPAVAPVAPVRRRGVATTWLETKICAPFLNSQLTRTALLGTVPTLRIFLRPTRDFVPPVAEKPIIMIGPGTGVAPFRGFLQHRRARLEQDARARTAVCTGMWRPGVRIETLQDDAGVRPPVQLGDAVLFFGCRRRDEDFLYESDWRDFGKAGVLQALHTAFSRENATKMYVQHRMREAGAALAHLIIVRGASIFVCGDGAAMAKDVHAALIELLVHHGNAALEVTRTNAEATGIAPATLEPTHLRNDADAVEYLAALAKRGRYVRDIWS